MATRDQIILIHTLLPKSFKNADSKGDLVEQFTFDESKRSTKDLSFEQAEALIHYLRTGQVDSDASFAAFDKNNHRHRYILSLCYNLNWTTTRKDGKFIPDLNRLGGWLKKYGYLHKPLKKYSARELGKLINQFEKTTQHAYINNKN